MVTSRKSFRYIRPFGIFGSTVWSVSLIRCFPALSAGLPVLCLLCRHFPLLSSHIIYSFDRFDPLSFSSTSCSSISILIRTIFSIVQFFNVNICLTCWEFSCCQSTLFSLSSSFLFICMYSFYLSLNSTKNTFSFFISGDIFKHFWNMNVVEMTSAIIDKEISDTILTYLKFSMKNVT